MPVDDPQLFLLELEVLYEGAGQAEATKEPQDAEVGVHGFVCPLMPSTQSFVCL